jgi:hypothetical protein
MHRPGARPKSRIVDFSSSVFSQGLATAGHAARVSKKLLEVIRARFDFSLMGSTVVTDCLVPTPSTIVGAGAIFNLSGGYFVYNTSPCGEDADADAIRRDWLIASHDLKKAIEVSKLELAREKK